MSADADNKQYNNSDEKEMTGPEILLTRRHFLYGALGVGALAIAASHPSTVTFAHADDEDEISILEVPEDAVFSLENCTEIPSTDAVYLAAQFQLPYGSLIWNNNESFAACLLPTETAHPLTQAGVVYLGSGTHSVLLETAVEHEQGYDIYDVRLNDHGIIWTEANVLSEIWSVYCAVFDGSTIGEPFKVAEGDAEWETPTIATVGSYAYWQILPVATGAHSSENSTVHRVGFGKTNIEEVYASQGRMCTPIYPLADSLVITPRTATDSVHHQLTLLDGESAEVKDTLVLPQSMKPLEAGYGKTGFNFAFDGIYNYGDGIANLGTYTPASKHGAYDYGNKTWFRFERVPSAGPAWCNDLFIVKSTRSVCGVNLENKTYFALDYESGSDSYGDYLATTGSGSNFVSYTNINTETIDGQAQKHCLVRVWAPHQ